MSSLFRYFSSTYAGGFVQHGEVLFRALSYFRDYEEQGVRGDNYEGTRAHRPSGGLIAKKVPPGEEILLPHTFESTANEDDIFVYCLSTVLSRELASSFQADICVEISSPGLFIGRIRNALARRPSVKNKHIEYGPVNYYELHDPPIVDWALPERIALSKPAAFSWQREYRVAFGVNGAFDVENVQVRLVEKPRNIPATKRDHPSRLLKLGNMSDICTIHEFS